MGEKGQGLYELYCRGKVAAGGMHPGTWDELTPSDQAGWAAVEDHVLSISRAEPEPQTPPADEARGRYEVVIFEQDREIARDALDDPFIRTTLKPKGWRAALLALMGDMKLEVTVSADPETTFAVMNLEVPPPGTFKRQGISMEARYGDEEPLVAAAKKRGIGRG